MSVSSAVILITSDCRMPRHRYMPNSFFLRLMRNRSAYMTRNARITMMNTDTPLMTMPKSSIILFAVPRNSIAS